MTGIPQILVAGASPDARRRLTNIMREQPWHVFGATEEETVLDLVRSGQADLVIIESQSSPSLDGLEVCRRIRGDERQVLLPILLISSRDSTAERVAAIEAGADDLLTRPFEGAEVVARVRSLLLLKTMRDRLENVRQVIIALAKAAEAKDLFTLQHAERVSDSSIELARRVNMPRDAIEQVRVGALIHDVGKIAVPDHILNKPARLTPDEFEVIKRHSVVGAEIVKPLAGQHYVYDIVRNHHERYDGTGYPDGLAGEAIPLAARIVAVCDAFDAMVSPRSYRGPASHADALATLLAGRGTQWDGALVDAFVAIQESATSDRTDLYRTTGDRVRCAG